MLDGFEPIILGNMHGPSVSITKNGITFSKATAEAIPKTKITYVLLSVNRGTRQFAITPASKEDIGAIPFVSTNPNTSSVRWNNKELLRLFSGMMDWKLKECAGYRIPGQYSKEAKAILFDLKSAIAIA